MFTESSEFTKQMYQLDKEEYAVCLVARHSVQLLSGLQKLRQQQRPSLKLGLLLNKY